jgi:hypothetical protein
MLLDAKAKEAAKAATDLLEAKTKLLGDRYMALHPNITQAGVASAYAAGKISESVAQYISMQLAIQKATGDLANLQRQAGLNPVATPKGGGGIQGGANRADQLDGAGLKDDGSVAAATALLKQRTQNEKDLAEAQRRRIEQTGTAAQKEKLLQDDLNKALKTYGKNSAEAVNAQTQLDLFRQSQLKQATTAANKDAKAAAKEAAAAQKADLDLQLAQQDDALSKLQVKRDALVASLSKMKAGITDYKETQAQLLTIEKQIADAKEKQGDGA